MSKKMLFLARGVKKGFTLIELMIVIVIVGVFSAFAIPMYQDYTVRTRVAEGLYLASAAKDLVVANAANGYDFDSGYIAITATKNTQSINIDESNGVITIEGTPAAGGFNLILTPQAAGVALLKRRIPTGAIAWTCTSTASNPSQVPSECR